MYRRNLSNELFERVTFDRAGALYEPYRAQRWCFGLVSILPTLFVKALLVAFAKRSAWVQVIGFILIDLAGLAAQLGLRPHLTRRSDVLATFLALVRAVSSGLLIAFVPGLSVKPIPRVAIGFVLDVLYSVAIVVMFFQCAVERSLR